MNTTIRFNRWRHFVLSMALPMAAAMLIILPSAAFAEHSSHGSFAGFHGGGSTAVRAATPHIHASAGFHGSYARGYAPRYSHPYYGHGYGYRGYGYRGYGYGHYYGPGFFGALALGTYVASLPLYYNTYWWGGVPYYYYDDTYYRWDNGANEYEVVAPPNGVAAPSAANNASSISSDNLYVYPKNGQSDAQQKTDRYECHRWAADQTGFDPSNTNDTAVQTGQKQVEYRRAETACLNGRGYSVQ